MGSCARSLTISAGRTKSVPVTSRKRMNDTAAYGQWYLGRSGSKVDIGVDGRTRLTASDRKIETDLSLPGNGQPHEIEVIGLGCQLGMAAQTQQAEQKGRA